MHGPLQEAPCPEVRELNPGESANDGEDILFLILVPGQQIRPWILQSLKDLHLLRESLNLLHLFCGTDGHCDSIPHLGVCTY